MTHSADSEANLAATTDPQPARALAPHDGGLPGGTCAAGTPGAQANKMARTLVRWAAGLTALGAVSGLVLSGGAAAPATLEAQGIVSGDSDGDGLDDLLEGVLGTRIDLVDTDGDGSSDLLEVARQTDPLRAADRPGSGSQRVGLAGYVENQMLTVLTAVYVPGGDVSAINLRFGVSIDGITAPVRSSIFLAASSVQTRTSSGSDSVYVFETRVSESSVHAFGNAAFYVIADQVGFDSSPAVLQMVSFPGTGPVGEPMPVLMRPEPAPPGMGLNPPGPSPQSQSGTRAGGGTIFRPLTADERVPLDWETGKICFQEMEPVGANGVNVVLQVDSAACETFDTFCAPSNCQATVGQTVEFVDPGALVGG